MKPKLQTKKKFNAMDHWKGMPEFNNENLKPIKQITISFASKDDMLKFSKLIGQQITAKTRTVWFPPISNTAFLDKRYINKK